MATEDKPAIPAPAGDEDGQGAGEGESGSESFTKSISTSAQPLREDQIQNAMKFLSHPKVRGSPVVHRRSFLEKKGLTREEIDEAFRRVPDPPSNVTSAETATTIQANQQKPSANLPQQVPSTVQPLSAPLVGSPATSTVQHYRFHWSHAVIAIGALAASGAGTAVLLKNVVVPKLKAWIRKVVREEDDTKKTDNSKPNLAEEAAEAAKVAASAAAIVAKASQELLNARAEDGKYFQTFKELMNVQVEEMKSLGNSIRKLESSRESKSLEDRHMLDYNKYSLGNGFTTSITKNYHADQSGSDISAMVTKQGHATGLPDNDSERPSSAPTTNSTAPPYSKSYLEVMNMIQRGEIPPGIKEINDIPPYPYQPPANPQIAPRLKPWEIIKQDQQKNEYGFQAQARGSGYPAAHNNGSFSQLNGKYLDASEAPWERKTVKVTEIEPEVEENKPTSYGIGSSEWRGRGWVPPQPPTVAIPEAAAAIRQPKLSAQKKLVESEQSVVKPDVESDAAIGTICAPNAGESSYLESTAPDNAEIQEEPTDHIEVK